MTASSGQAAIANADRYSTYEVGYCLKWVRTCWEIGSLYGSAIEAWNGARHKHPGDRNPPDGAPCFYSGGTYGHIVVYRKHDSRRMRSTDCPSSGRVSDADLSWPESAWGSAYLGWTEDLNGVDLPIGAPEPTPPPEEEPMPKWIRARMTKPLKLSAQDEWKSIAWDAVPAGSDVVTPGDSAIRIGGRTYTATLTAKVSVSEATKSNQTISTRFLERSKKGDTWQTDETYPAVEHPVTTGPTFISQAAVQGVAEGRRLVAQIKLPEGGTIEVAEFNALYF